MRGWDTQREREMDARETGIPKERQGYRERVRVARVSHGTGEFHSPLREIESSFQIVLVCTARRRIPASTSTNQGPEQGDLILLGGLQAGARTSSTEGRRLAEYISNHVFIK